MLKYLALATGSLAIGGLLVGYVALRNDESTEKPGDASLLEDADACPAPTDPSAVAVEPSPVAPGWTPYLQSPEEALAQDMALVAQSRGWTLEQAEAHFRASEALDPITSRLSAERPDVFVGSALPGDPGLPAKVYVKGPADDTVRDIVAAAEVKIDIVDNQPYSRAELEDREIRLFGALRELGFASVSGGSDMTNRGQIDAVVIRQVGLPDDPEEILAALPSDLREGVTLTVNELSKPCDSDSGSSSSDFGPLAVFRTDGGLDARGGTGPINIGNECVTLTNEGGQDLLLVWAQQAPGGEVAWNEEEREITFRSPGDSPVTIRHSDVITVGGSDLDGDPLERDLDWLAQPHESCTGDPWVVSSVIKEP